ncbi:hypothetical protein ACQW02_20005 [Humitalea sp. 24SJ18S-53]|uniref:hypothetical protein n=1 Tax=Humitalea sp. 24SJ18S-53 TaxID=3422307 RepID=UPI003D669A35
MAFARIVDGRVAEIIPASETPIAERFHPDVVATLVAATPDVTECWTWDGQAFAPPPAPEPAPAIRVIRSLAFRERLAEDRRADLNVAAMQAAVAGDGTLLSFLLDQTAGTTTHLDDPRVVAGVAQLLNQGLVSGVEAAALLADGTSEEAA